MWLAFVQIVPAEGYQFADLIDTEGAKVNEIYIGAFCNVLVKHSDIREAIGIIEAGLKEKNWDLMFIDKIENIESLAENEELDEQTLDEIHWLYNSEYVFMISDKLFPYTEE